MRRPGRLLAVAVTPLVALSLLLVFPAAVAAETIYVAELTGDQEVPGPGDPDGLGYAELRIDPAGGQVCAFISVEGIAEPTMAHIHVGAEDAFGAVVVTLPTPTGGEVDDCVEGLDEATLQAIVDDPGGYYVNVHNADFEAGAIRGQLEALDVAPVTIAKFACPPEIQSPEDLEAAPAGTCLPVATEIADPPAGYEWAGDALLFPEMAITLIDDGGELTLDDTVPGEGGTTCNPSTLVCGGAGVFPRQWPTVIDGQVDVFQETFPDGYAFGWGEVVSGDESDPDVVYETFEDGVSFDLDTQTFQNGVVVRLYDIAIQADAPARLLVEKFACPEGIDEASDLSGPVDELCHPVAAEGRIPPAPDGHTYDPEPITFDLELLVSAGGSTFDMADAGPIGDGFCDPKTLTCQASGAYEFGAIPSGETVVLETSFPAGYRFGWAVLTDLQGNPLEITVDPDAAEVNFETAPGADVILTIVDIVGVQPTPAPTVTPPPTASAAGPTLTVDLAPILVVLAGVIGLVVSAARRRPGWRA